MCCSLQALAGSGKPPMRIIERTTPFAIHVVSGENNGERGGAPCLRIDAVMEMCSRWGDSGKEWTGVLVLIPIVLGLKKVNPRLSYIHLIIMLCSFFF
jgi:cysteine protease ATG4